MCPKTVYYAMTRSSPDPPASSTAAISRWSRDQDIAFEDALAVHDEQCKNRWEKIAALVPGKDAAEIKLHYEILVEDIECIEAGLIPLPSYVSSGEGSADQAVEIQGTKNRSHSANFHSGDVNPTRKGGSKADQERRKGIAWTEEEHRLFLLGLDKFGKGDWRSISRNFVISRTPTQVASHAQKYYNRLNSANKDRRRSSIHDITSVNDGDTSTPQGPITGQENGSSGAVGKPPKSSSQPSLPRVVAYGPPVGQPIAGPASSAVGTPIMVPPGHVPYVSRGPLPGSVVPGTPMNVVPVAYAVSQPTMHQ